jgi:dTDP-4-amino-4,6-dideoxygalactose transaminase
MLEFQADWSFLSFPNPKNSDGEPVEKAVSGSALSTARIPLCRPYLSEEEELATIEVLRSGWLMQGAKTAEFERLTAERTAVKHAIALNSGTSALTLSLMALGLKHGDETIVPSCSFVATANSTVHLGGNPVFVDIGPDDYNIDPSKIEAAIGENTRAIVVVHQFGFPADMDPITAIAKKHKLAVIEDAACSLGSSYHGRQTGGFGDAACLSFHPRKVITTGEGGMVLTNSDDIAETVRLMRNHGLSPATRSGGCTEAGFNFRLTDIQAAIGIVQLAKLDEIVRLRSQIAETYIEAISKMPSLRLPKWPGDSIPNFQSFVVELTDPAIDRQAMLASMEQRGIGCGPGIFPIHMQPAYREKHASDLLPETLRAAERSFLLPLSPDMTEDEQRAVIGGLREALAEQSIK